MFMSSSFSFQLDSYEVELKFHVLSFATEAIDIVDIRDSQISGITENVIWYLMEFDYHSRTPVGFSFIQSPYLFIKQPDPLQSDVSSLFK